MERENLELDNKYEDTRVLLKVTSRYEIILTRWILGTVIIVMTVVILNLLGLKLGSLTFLAPFIIIAIRCVIFLILCIIVLLIICIFIKKGKPYDFCLNDIRCKKFSSDYKIPYNYINEINVSYGLFDDYWKKQNKGNIDIYYNDENGESRVLKIKFVNEVSQKYEKIIQILSQVLEKREEGIRNKEVVETVKRDISYEEQQIEDNFKIISKANLGYKQFRNFLIFIVCVILFKLRNVILFNNEVEKVEASRSLIHTNLLPLCSLIGVFLGPIMLYYTIDFIFGKNIKRIVYNFDANKLTYYKENELSNQTVISYEYINKIEITQDFLERALRLKTIKIHYINENERNKTIKVRHLSDAQYYYEKIREIVNV